uniref:Erythronate-4-phosphate dehydrogenase family protein n=1 Tax=Davidia involucrata TaxID=16924 RepID=A0A5B7AFB3_DAVIN
MENSHETVNGNGPAENGQCIMRNSPYQPCTKVSLSWLDLRVFYVRVTKCEIDDSTPEYLTLNHIPLNHDTPLEVNGVRTSIYSDCVSTLLRRDRLDKKSEEVTFVSTDSIRMMGSVKFEVFNEDILVLSGVLELCNSNGCIGESKNQGRRWNMSCESDNVAGTGFLKGRQSISPTIEVYVAGSFSGIPIILTKTLELSSRKKQTRKGMLDSIPEYEATESQKDVPNGLALQGSNYPNYKTENEDYNNLYSGTEYLEGEDGELSWFNAGVRVGMGIGLSVCLGIGIGVGLIVRTCQGTTRNFRRRLL